MGGMKGVKPDRELVKFRKQLGKRAYLNLYNKCRSASEKIRLKNLRASGLVYDNPPEKLERIKGQYLGADENFLNEKIMELIGNGLVQ